MSDARQLELLAWKPKPVTFGSDFDGATFEPKRDGKRLNKQLTAVFELMRDGKWRTLEQISQVTKAPLQSASARLRDLTKQKFGQHTKERRFVADGLFEYRIIENKGN